jgi:GNAT superfamily N-acetyltransferase
MSYDVVEAGPEAWDLVSDTVIELLAELEDEARDLGTLDREAVRARWTQRPALMRVVLAKDENAVLGLLTLTEGFAIYANGSFGIIPEMYVRPEARGAGVGAALVEAAKRIGRSKGWSRIEVTAPESERWERTVRFYKSNGFVYAGPKLKFSFAANCVTS